MHGFLFAVDTSHFQVIERHAMVTISVFFCVFFLSISIFVSYLLRHLFCLLVSHSRQTNRFFGTKTSANRSQKQRNWRWIAIWIISWKWIKQDKRDNWINCAKEARINYFASLKFSKNYDAYRLVWYFFFHLMLGHMHEIVIALSHTRKKPNLFYCQI